MAYIDTIREIATKVAHGFENGQYEQAYTAYKSLLSEYANIIAKLAEGDEYYRVFHINAAKQCVLFDVLHQQHPKASQAFTIDLTDFTFGQITSVVIDEASIEYVEQAEYADGINRAGFLRKWNSEYSAYGYTRETVPIAVLYATEYIVNDLFENLPYLKPGRDVVDIGASTGLINLFIRQIGYEHFYLIDIDENALSAGQQMVQNQGIQNFHYLTPDQITTIPHERVDMIHSFRSWAFKYPFEEYEELFLKCLKPGLVVGINPKTDMTPGEDSSLISKAKDRKWINKSKLAPRQIFTF